MNNISIHKTAIVDPGAKLSSGVDVGPYAIVDGEVILGENVIVGNHCVVTGKTKIGKDCRLYSHAVVGSDPQDKKHATKDDVYLEIGEGNTIREFTTINPGTIDGGSKTVIGNNNLIMAYAHIAHDCIVGNNCILANAATLAGHVLVEDQVIVGGFSAVHQFSRLGKLCIIGGCSKVVRDVPPFSMCDGHPAKVHSTNAIGLQRADISKDTINILRKALKILFRSGLTRAHALEQLSNDLEMVPELEHLIAFAKASERGLCR